MKIKELLPIGSVIWLRDAKKPLMIFGIRQTNMDDNVEYDYIGVLYPEGNMGVNSQFMFNHEDIEKVVFRGFEDESRTEFLERLNGFYAARDKEDPENEE